jgi:hypothetical protein
MDNGQWTMDKADILQPVDQRYQVNSINDLMLDTLAADNFQSIDKCRQMRFFTICLFSFFLLKRVPSACG